MKKPTEKEAAFVAERNRVALFLDESMRDISEIGGNVHMFSKCLLIAALEMEQELTSTEIVSDGLIKLAQDMSAFRNSGDVLKCIN